MKMTDEKMVTVRWATCTCDVWTKYCDEFHTQIARIPLSKIKQWIEDIRLDTTEEGGPYMTDEEFADSIMEDINLGIITAEVDG